MIWLWVVGYLAVACGVAYLVGRFGDSDMRDKVIVVAGMWPFITVLYSPFALVMLLIWFCELGERHSK